MKSSGTHLLAHFAAKWRLFLWWEVVLISLGISIGVYFALSQLTLAIGIGAGCIILLAFLKKPWRINATSVSSYLDEHQTVLEHSTSLLLIPKQELSGIAQLQQNRTAIALPSVMQQQQHHIPVFKAAGVALLLILVGWGIGHFTEMNNFSTTNNIVPTDKISFVATDSVLAEQIPPTLVSQQVSVRYPAYTNRASYTTDVMDVRALINSTISWQISFSAEVDSVFIESLGNKRAMRSTKDGYVGSIKVNQSGFYYFRFVDRFGNSYASKLYAIEAFEDEAPSVEISGINQYTSFDHFDPIKKLEFSTAISDDFGIADAYIIATVTKGEGESVKFREEKINFNRSIQRGSRKSNLMNSVDLDALQMKPGEELYFYVETLDLKQPSPNRSRSETYFAIIKDTTQYGEGFEGGMAADLMPDYFRSQRQLIIDTEKLISEKRSLTVSEFNSTSNALGFDQKALRLKYGQFMGDEADSGLDIEQEHEHEEGNEASEEDPLADYTHDHDGDNEHNLVPEEEEEEEGKNPLSQFVHDHGDPEAATLFNNTLKGKLRQAMNYMWDAELHLRLYKPENSLPFQYKALKLIQDIKNSARIYVHRIGFDPPPVKESARLTGDLDEVSGSRKTSDIGKEDVLQNTRKAISRLEILLDGKTALTEQDRTLFKNAGQELSLKAIEEPIAFLPALQALKRLSEEQKPTIETLRIAQKGLLKSIPLPQNTEGQQQQWYGPLDQLLLKELEIND